jgi:uncharacterized integral membrane protein
MFILFIIGIIIGACTIVFALQNIVPVSVVFLGWHFDGSLALILIIAALAGAVMTVLFTVPETIVNHFRFRELQQKNSKLAKALEEDEKILHDQQKNADTIVIVGDKV